MQTHAEPAMDYTFGVDSSSCFSFRARTATYRHTNSHKLTNASESAAHATMITKSCLSLNLSNM